MNNIESIWLLLSDDCCCCCNESEQLAESNDVMTLDMFRQIAELVVENSWECKVLTNDHALPKGFEPLLARLNAELILPIECELCSSGATVTVVLDTSQVEMMQRHASVSKGILRVKHSDLSHLSETVIALLQHVSDVSIRHPELQQYKDEDMLVYSDQLHKIARWLLTRKRSWRQYRIDCLTDRFCSNDLRQCGAGVKRIAVGPRGDLYVCPAAAKHPWSSCGHILSELDLPNSRLYTREYSVPCTKCDAVHCTRCVYQSKLSTFEVCVPSRNVCLLANYEQEVQAWLAQEAVREGLWDEGLVAPKPPVAYDPFELVKAEDDVPAVYSWRRLTTFDGDSSNPTPAMMLDIVHGLQGWCQAVAACAEAGNAPSIGDLEKDTLASLRRRSIEHYRDVVIEEGCPMVREIEILMCRLAGI
jgi:CXXX repeat peptide maturase